MNRLLTFFICIAIVSSFRVNVETETTMVIPYWIGGTQNVLVTYNFISDFLSNLLTFFFTKFSDILTHISS